MSLERNALENWVWIFVCLTGCWSFALEDTLPKGSLRFKTTIGLLDAEQYFNYLETEEAMLVDGQSASHEAQAMELEVEYGLSPQISLIWETTYLKRELAGNGGTVDNSGIPGIYMAVKQRLNNPASNIRLLAETGVFIPTDADENEALPIGSDSIDWVTIMSYNQYFYPTRGGFEMDFGYRFRNEAPADEVFFDTSLSLQVYKLGVLRLEYHMVESNEETKRIFDVLTYPRDRGHQRFHVEINRTITKRWRFGVGYTDVIKGRNQVAEDGVRVWFEWRR